MSTSQPLRAISLFTGAGGLDYGFEAAGIETAVALEMDGACCRVLRANRRWPIIEDDVHNVASATLLNAAAFGKSEASVLIGGPPCQPFSKSGYWASGDAGRLNDKRADTLTAYLRILEDTLPRAMLLENVYGLAYRGKDEGLDRLVRGIEAINRRCGTNYNPAWQVLNAAAYGVPQLRERVFVVASRDGREFSFPKPSHCAPEVQVEGLEPYRTCWDALGDLDRRLDDDSLKATGKWAELLPTIPEGENYLWHTGRGGGRPLFGWRTRYWNFLLKLAKNRPSWTIQAQPGSATGPFHWDNRKLSTQELCRLQTFPEIRIETSRSVAQRMLGNAVPSLLAEVLAREIAVQLLDQPAYRHPPTLLPPLHREIPAPEPVRTVTRPYLALIDNHEDHPGTGLGRRARERRVA